MSERLPSSTKTTCPYCGVGCGVLATRHSNGTVTIEGDKQHPANFGRLCSKGSALGETVDLEGRLLVPEVFGNQAGWDEALDLVAKRFRDTIDKHGPDSVAFYVSGQILTEDYYVANKLMKGFIGSANIDTNSRLCMASSVAGHRRAFGADTVPGMYEDLELADLIVLTGSNLAWCHPVIYQRIVAAKAARPEMKVVLIDPRRTMTADVADVHLAIEPDGDLALFMGLLSHISDAGQVAEQYVEAHTSGFEETLTKASELSVDQISSITGLSVAELCDFYDLWVRTEKTVTVYSQGVNQSAIGTDKVNAIINCHLATARIGKPGMGPFSITGQPNAMGGREVGGLANMLAAHMALENPEHRDRVQRFWNSPVIADRPGLKAVDMFDAVADGRIKAIWIMATNPVDSMPAAAAVEEALQKCPFVVVSDVMETTDTVRHAHVKLPSLAWGEKDGTVTNSERRISRQKAFLGAPGEARADWWQMAEVGKRLGYEEAFDFEDASSVFREYARQTAFENDGRRDLDIGAYANVSFEAYDEMEPFQWPKPAGQTTLYRETRFFANGGFFTADRLAKFVPVAVPTPAEKSEPDGFVLNTGRIRDQWHTVTRTAKAARLSTHIAEPYVEIHPKDADQLAIGNAELVTVKNDRGEVVVRASITDRVKMGQCFVPIHFTDQVASNARVDKLVAPVTDPFSGQPALKGSRIELERFEAKQYGFVVGVNRPVLSAADYWAIAKTNEGWRAEIALLTDQKDVSDHIRKLLGLSQTTELLVLEDEATHTYSVAAFENDILVGAVYLSREPVAASRSWVCAQLGMEFSEKDVRWRVAAGRPPADMPDKGAIVCSCMHVGVNEIRDAASLGNNTLEAICKTTTAGTNCGSCKSEIKAILNEYRVIAAE